MTRQLTDEEKIKLTERFDAVGVGVVQMHLASGSSSAIVDTRDATDPREFAKEWVDGKLSSIRTRRKRRERYLFVGTVAAVVAAIFSIIASGPTWWPWLVQLFGQASNRL